jgi:PAS domain S-box-containing protein
LTNHIKIISCFSIIFLFFCMTIPASGENERINIGVLATRGAEDTLRTWSPTAEYLTQEIPQYSFVIVPLDFDEIIPAIERKEVDFIITNPSNYVELESSYGTTRIATMNSIYEGHTYKVFGSAILRRAERNDIKELKDLKGKSFMGTDEKLMAWQMTWREFKDNGIDPYRDFAELKFIGLPQDLIVYAVRDKKADAGAVRTGILESMADEGKINLADFIVINQKQNEDFPFLHSTGLYPEWAFARAKQTSDNLSENVSIALLRMSPDSAASKAANAAWTVPLDYGPVNDLMKDLRIGPYKDYGKITIGNVIREYWYLIIIVFAALFLTSGFALYASKTNKKLNNTRIELEKARNNLELRVDERTEDFKKTTERLQESEKRFSIFMANLPAGVFIKDDAGNTLYANQYLSETFLTPEWAGKKTLDLLPEEVARQMIKDDQRVFAENRLVIKEETLVVHGSKRIFETYKFPIPVEGKPDLLGGIAVDITERKMAEEQIKNSLKEKELLLKEIHHRVKNNLQIVSSLITLQSEYINEKEGQKAFAESKNRIDTMALIHEKLYMSADISRIDFSDYVSELVGNLFISYGINTDVIKSKIDIVKVFFDINTAIPLGLMINELVSNIMKHAFPEGRKGEFLISLHLYESCKFTLVISDNGIGFPQDLDFTNTRSLGLKLVNSLTKQLGGTIEIDRKTGTTFKIIFQITNYKKGESG